MNQIETFLTVNAAEIPAPARAKIRQAAVDIIRGKPASLDACPEHLRGALLDIIEIDVLARIENSLSQIKI